MTTPVDNNSYVNNIKSGFNSYVKPAIWSCGELGVRVTVPLVWSAVSGFVAKSLGADEKTTKEIQGATVVLGEIYLLKGYVAPAVSTAYSTVAWCASGVSGGVSSAYGVAMKAIGRG